MVRFRASLNRKSGARLLPLLLGMAAASPGLGQVASLDSLRSQLAGHQQRALIEKLFLHLDRPLYLTGETMWLKAYAVDGTYGRPLALSTVAYVEVLDKSRHPVLQGKISLQQATGQGSFVLPASLPSGTYTVRAYTSWMKNAGPEYYFHSNITVLNTTTPSGTAAVKDTAVVDVQFFPEGGNLVRGLASKVAFKVTGRNGLGLAAEGQLQANGQVVGSFRTQRYGMGSFDFTPEAGTVYTAVLTLPNKQVLRRPLPQVYEQGYVLRLDNTSPEELTLSVIGSSPQPETVYLLAHSRQKTGVAAQATLVNGRAVFLVKKSQLLPGVSHFTLFNAARQPVSERLFFQAPAASAFVTARADKAQYTTRDKVTVQVAAGRPDLGPASLSMAVYRLDSLNTTPGPNIAASLWLGADLKGYIEDPDYYLSTSDPEAVAAADHLMLTQGWSRFRWEDVLAGKPKAPEHLPELNGPVLQARLTQAGTGKPVPNVTAYLSAPSRVVQLSSSVSDANGLVRFEAKHLAGSREIVLQSNPLQDSTCRVTLLDPFSTRYAPVAGPAFATSSRLQADYSRRHLQAQLHNAYFGKQQSRLLAPPSDSLAFYGRPNETYLLDKYTRFQVLEEVLREYVPGVTVRVRKGGYHLLVVDKVNKMPFQESPMVLVDGVPIFNANKVMAINPLKVQKLDVLTTTYFHGPALYYGLVSFSTYKGDLDGLELDARALLTQYEGVQLQREFYAPRYETPQEKQSRLPDLRNLLYWNPNVNLTGPGPRSLEFYTGDQAGRYLVVLQGLSAAGQAGSSTAVLEVKPAL